MAKWGEGDPRWIVEERPDATNVNNWHWTEKNADSWSKKKLEDLFVDCVVEDPKIGTVVIEEMEKCDGEARVNNRKAKLIFFYEWEIGLKWKGCVNGNDAEIKGTITIPNLSDEHEDVKDVDLEVGLTTTSGPEAQALKEMLRKGKGLKAIREKLENYVDSLRTEYGSGLILPAKDSTTAAAVQQQPKKQTSSATVINRSCGPSQQMKKLDIGCSVPTANLEMSENFKCTGQELYNVLTQKEMIQIFTGGEVKLKETKKGETFEMLGGNVLGSFVELEPFTKIVQKWRLKSWPEGHFSRVEMEIKQSTDDTRLKLKQTDVPEKELDNTRQGWKRYYWDSIKKSFGFGSTIY